VLVTLFRLPVHTVTSAALAGTFATSAAAVASYHLLALFHPATAVQPDWALGVLFGAGGLAGMYVGALAQRFVSARAIKLILAACSLIPAGAYLRAVF
jgi:uncharacterized membrane protein YfcA